MLRRRGNNRKKGRKGKHLTPRLSIGEQEVFVVQEEAGEGRDSCFLPAWLDSGCVEGTGVGS